MKKYFKLKGPKDLCQNLPSSSENISKLVSKDKHPDRQKRHFIDPVLHILENCGFYIRIKFIDHHKDVSQLVGKAFSSFFYHLEYLINKPYFLPGENTWPVFLSCSFVKDE